MFLFVLSGTVTEISTRTRNEVIVYNSPGSSTIGIKTGKLLNLFSDTSLVRPEVLRHCATLGLKIKTNTLSNNMYCIEAGKKKILITNSINKNILKNFMPDIVILTGLRPEIEKDLSLRQFPGTLIITSKATSGFRLQQQIDFAGIVTVHHVKKSGAYIKKI